MEQLLQQIAYYIILFFLFSFGGWCMEVTLKYIQYHRFINRGFLIGPYCPIYGAGAVLVTLLVQPLVDPAYKVVTTFLVSFVVCGALEYFVSWYMEKVFHARWWDYSMKPMNMDGRIWIGNLLAFGVAGVVVIKWVNPVIGKMFFSWSSVTMMIVAVMIVLIMGVDAVLTRLAMQDIRVEGEKTEGDDTEAVSKQVLEVIRSKSFWHKHIAKAYPNMIVHSKSYMKKQREERKELSRRWKEYSKLQFQKIREKGSELVQSGKEKLDSGKEALVQKKEELVQKKDEFVQKKDEFLLRKTEDILKQDAKEIEKDKEKDQDKIVAPSYVDTGSSTIVLSKKEAKTENTECFENRELSWLKFNQRVLEEAQNEKVPLCERLTFLSIFQTNLDEFFMVRVGSLHDQMILNDSARENKTYLSPSQQISAILKCVSTLESIFKETYDELLESLQDEGVHLVNFAALKKNEASYFEAYFTAQIMPLLTPIVVDKRQPFPFLKGGDIYAVGVLENHLDKDMIGIIPCAPGVFERLLPVPGRKGYFMLAEELILHFLPLAFKKYTVTAKTLLRVTRNADIDADHIYDEDLDYRQMMEQLIKNRRRLCPVRLELSRELDKKMIRRFCEYLDLAPEQVFLQTAPLDMSFVFKIQDELYGKTNLFFEKRQPQPSPELDTRRSILDQVVNHDVLLSYPYERIQPFIQMLEEAAQDPDVVSIKMTLYRLAKNSQVVAALVNAAEHGKQVDVMVELKARFDEENNIQWSRHLEEAGCHVMYGLDDLKVHSKLCLITRRKEGKIQHITQIGTGNYNEKTSRLYTDLSLITGNEEIGCEAANVFNALFLGQVVETTNYLLVAPKCLQNKVLQMIDEEIHIAKDGGEAYIGLKLNSITDKTIILKLIEASKAGVKIDMIVRGICCLRSKIKGSTDNIRIISIVGRFLEHSRIYIFGKGEREKMYIGSADFMTRNTLRRVEVAAPIFDPQIKTRIRNYFNTQLADNQKAREQKKNGEYSMVSDEGQTPLNSQEYCYEQAYENAKKL